MFLFFLLSSLTEKSFQWVYLEGQNRYSCRLIQSSLFVPVFRLKLQEALGNEEEGKQFLEALLIPMKELKCLHCSISVIV